VAVLCGWEGNRRYGIAPDMHGISTYELNGLRKGDEHPAIRLNGLRGGDKHPAYSPE